MAEIKVYVSDDEVLDYIQTKFGLEPGKASAHIGVDVVAQPADENSTVSHVVEVTLRYGLELGELKALTGF